MLSETTYSKPYLNRLTEITSLRYNDSDSLIHIIDILKDRDGISIKY